jgi:hypothetical protein
MRRRRVVYTAKCRSVQTPNDTRKQYASRAYRQQHRQIVPSATARNAHTNTVRVCTQLSILSSFRSVVGLRRLRLSGEPTSRHTSEEECVSWLGYFTERRNLRSASLCQSPVHTHRPKTQISHILSMSKYHHVSTFFQGARCAWEQRLG